MGKAKSAVCLVIITLIIAVLCVASTVTFSYGTNAMHTYNSFVNVMKKDGQLGGGYTAVYYPDGVISSNDYSSLKQEDKEKYVAINSAVYFEKESVLDEEGNVSSDFKQSFENNVKALTERFEAKHAAGVRVEVQDDYSVRVTLPSIVSAPSAAYTYFGYTGAFTIGYGSDADSAETVIAADEETPITEYVRGAYSRTAQETSYVVIDFTAKGQEIIRDTTAGAGDSSSTMFFKVGDNAAISLTVSSQIDQGSLFISGSYTEETAQTVAILINNAINGTQTDLGMTVSEVRIYDNAFGENALMFIYIAVGAITLLSAGYFFIKYRRLGFAHFYSYLSYLLCMIMCIAFIPFVYLSVGVLVAFTVPAALLCVSNAIGYEYARKEYALGKTMQSSVKTGYHKCFWHLLDLHIVLALIALLTYAIALTELQVFAFVLFIGTVFSAACTLVVNRFCWFIMMPFAKDKGKFCHFKREEVEDDE